LACLDTELPEASCHCPVCPIAADDKRLDRLGQILPVEAYAAICKTAWPAIWRKQMLFEESKPSIDRGSDFRNAVLSSARRILNESLESETAVESIHELAAAVVAIRPTPVASLRNDDYLGRSIGRLEQPFAIP
jgi:hypothetical protein